jgi:hypothetical protein
MRDPLMSGDSVRAWRYLLLAVLTFLLLGADMASVVVAKLLDGRSASDPGLWSAHWYATVGGFICSVVIWSLWIGVLLAWSRRRDIFGSLISVQAGSRAFAILLAGAVVLGGMGLIEARTSGGHFPSRTGEYQGFVKLYAGHGLVVTIFQYLYYVLESAMIVALLSLFQRAFEKWTHHALVPWGGIALALSWGAGHLGTHPEEVILIMLIALLYGVVFVLAEKSGPATLALVYLGFVL